jgi:hypothetical protein
MGGMADTGEAPDRRPMQEFEARLNDAFYRDAPYHYFNQRFSWLVAAAAQMDDPDLPILPEFPGLTSALGAVAELDETSFVRERRRTFVAAEAQVLLHQVAEALLRLVRGHIGDPPCPWLQMASDRSFSEFKRWIADDVVGVGPSATAAMLRRHVGAPTSAEPAAQSARDGWPPSALDNMNAFLRALARRYLEDANLYNSAKHGFAVKGGHHELRFVTDPNEDGETSPDQLALDRALSVHGVTLEHLESESLDGGPTWYRTLRFIDIDQDLALIHGGIRTITLLWDASAARYSGGGVVEVPLVEADPATIAARTSAGRAVIRIPITARPAAPETAAAVIDAIRRRDGDSKERWS